MEKEEIMPLSGRGEGKRENGDKVGIRHDSIIAYLCLLVFKLKLCEKTFYVPYD